MSAIDKFISDQLSVWPFAAANFRSLKSAQVRDLSACGFPVKLQYNPCRIVSSTAKIDPQTLASRACFLCEENLPKEQTSMPFEGKKGRTYRIQINPYPIFRGHLVIVRGEHLPQSIWHHFPDMLLFSRLYPEYTVYYNGPVAGASAPDHLHFQGVPRGVLPLEGAVDSFLDNPGEPLASVQDATLYAFNGYTRGVFALKAATPKSMAKLAYRLLECSPRREGEAEPRFNLYCWCKGGEFRTMVVLRRELRSHHYFCSGPDHLTISPGAAEMAGWFVAPCEEDFKKATSEMLTDMIKQVSISESEENMVRSRLTRTQQEIKVGIMAAPEIVFEIISDGAGPQKVSWFEGKISYNGALYDTLTFDAVTRSTLFAEPTFILHDMLIGIDFHWQKKVTHKFAGQLSFVVEGQNIRAINTIGLEDYLLSVISSEMHSDAPLEYLKAHAIISRSWVLTNLKNHEHEGYNVCADDHCQRYQGVDMAVGTTVRDAIDQTWGKVLKYDGAICDCRFSKCCGGTMEVFRTCWEEVDVPYLQALPDAPAGGGDPFCAHPKPEVLAKVLNDYDLETHDFYEWEQRYTRSELSELVARRTGIDFGEIRQLEPIERGPSGRIKYLKVIGSKHTEVLGKELVIRHALSKDCLKSSAFDVEWKGDELILHGKGWGHGVGLCQIGAAVMSDEGYTFDQILYHYYPGTKIENI